MRLKSWTVSTKGGFRGVLWDRLSVGGHPLERVRKPVLDPYASPVQLRRLAPPGMNPPPPGGGVSRKGAKPARNRKSGPETHRRTRSRALAPCRRNRRTRRTHRLFPASFAALRETPPAVFRGLRRKEYVSGFGNGLFSKWGEPGAATRPEVHHQVEKSCNPLTGASEGPANVTECHPHESILISQRTPRPEIVLTFLH